MEIKYKHMFYSEDPRCWRCGKYSRYSMVSRGDITLSKDYKYINPSNIYENINLEECVSDEEVLLQQGIRGLYRIKHPFGPWRKDDNYTLEDIVLGLK